MSRLRKKGDLDICREKARRRRGGICREERERERGMKRGSAKEDRLRKFVERKAT